MKKAWTELSELPLSTRTQNTLIAAGITTAAAIPASYKELSQIPNLGLKGIQEIYAWRETIKAWEDFYTGR